MTPDSRLDVADLADTGNHAAGNHAAGNDAAGRDRDEQDEVPAAVVGGPTDTPTSWTARDGWVALAAVIGVALFHLAPATALPPGSLVGDLGIQYFLGSQTAGGAIPLLDFEHTWNVGAWYVNAVLHLLVGGDPSAWLYLWGRVLGPALAAVTAVGVMWRLRLPAQWILVGSGAWLALSHVVHAKYTIPVVWVFLLVSAPGRQRSIRTAMSLRAVLAGVTMLCQVELAVLLGGGVMLFDVLGRDPVWPLRRDRLARAAAIPAGIAVALGLELAVYQAIGQPPGEILRQLFSNAAETAEGFTYGYPALSPPSLRPKLFLPSMVVGFVPLIWSRLAPATRLVVCMHLTSALIAIRRPDPTHVDAATTLLGLLALLIVHDLWGGRPVRWRDAARRVVPVASGIVLMAGALWLAISLQTLLALALPVLLLAGLALAWRAEADRAAASVGAGIVIVALLVAGTAGGIITALRSGAAGADLTETAALLDAPIDRCSTAITTTAGAGGAAGAAPDARAVWIVPEPLPLYDELGLRNPTPWTVFWYGFTAEHDRVRDAVAAEEIPLILRRGGAWPDSFVGLDADLDAAYEVCGSVETPSGTFDVLRAAVQD